MSHHRVGLRRWRATGAGSELGVPLKMKGRIDERLPVKRAGRRLPGFIVLLGLLALGQQESAIAQAGSTGGTIGKTDKSISGEGNGADPRSPVNSRSKGKRPVESAASDQSSTARSKCTNIEGVWNSSGLSENIRQTGCNFSATVPAQYFNHAINGKYLGSSNYSLTITRTNKNDGCTTVMRGRMILTDRAGFQTTITSTDGRCDLSVNFTETRLWAR